GDLTDDGLVFQFEQARSAISKLKCDNIIIFPGNHDYRHTGYLLFEKFFPIARPDSSNVYEFREGHGSHQTVVVVATIGTAVPDRDEGEVGHSQNVWLDKILKAYDDSDQKQGGGRGGGSNSGKQIKKIVAMHHHLIAIPDTGYTNVVGISDAGDVLRTCLENDVDLVICGHKHRPWIWNLGNMKIAYAGTACSWRYRGVFEDTYNIIEINENGEIDIDLKVVGGKRIPLYDVVHKYVPEERIIE
ncbi:MAG: metallophosphoesterase, partial [Thermoproteota archaeon]|nr:metallophosphoesterase [Thermoproteota archaeon]